MAKKEVEPVREPVEGGICLYKDGGSQVFTQDDAMEALADGWKDNPADGAKKKRGPKRKVEETAVDDSADAEAEA